MKKQDSKKERMGKKIPSKKRKAITNKGNRKLRQEFGRKKITAASTTTEILNPYMTLGLKLESGSIRPQTGRKFYQLSQYHKDIFLVICIYIFRCRQKT